MYEGRVEFVFVYIREAHPADSNWAVGNQDADPQDLEQRQGLAHKACARLKLGMTTVVDDMDDSVSLAYHAWPERIFVIGTKGTIVYKGRPGPKGFRTDELESFLQDTIGPW